MNPEGWCGNCGETFRLAQVVTEGVGGRCPRCGHVYSHEYNAVVTMAVSQFLSASDAMYAALAQLADVAPLLHIDRAAFYKSLDAHLAR